MSFVYIKELEKLTPKGRALITACLKRAPGGCRDETCTNPCYSRAGLTFNGWQEFVKLEHEKASAQLIPDTPV